MKHFQCSVMSHGILLRSLGWAIKISAEISFSPPAHPSSYFMTSHNFRPYWPAQISALIFFFLPAHKGSEQAGGIEKTAC